MCSFRKVSFAAAALAGLVSTAAQADDFSRWEVRAGAVRMMTQSNSDGTLGLPGNLFSLGNKTMPEVGVSYFYTKNLAVELALTYPQKMDFSINGGGKLGTVDLLPATLNGQYHLQPDAALDPYIGAGLNFGWLTKTALNLPGLGLSKTSVNPGFQVGADYKVTKHWVANLDFRYEWMSFDIRSGSSQITTMHPDPKLFRLALGYKF